VPSGDDLPHFSLFNTASWLEPVPLGPASNIAVLMPVSRNSMSREPLGDGDVVVEVEHRLMTNDGYAGRYEVTGFALHLSNGVPLTPEAIRSMPLGEIFSRALLRSEGGDQLEPDLVQLTGDRIMRRGGRDRELILAMGLDNVRPTEQERICLVYTLAKLFGLDTNRALAEQFDMSPGAAAQRVRRLRHLGLLPPSEGQGRRR